MILLGEPGWIEGCFATVRPCKAAQRSAWLQTRAGLLSAPWGVWCPDIAAVAHRDRLAALQLALATLRVGGELWVGIRQELPRLGHVMRLLREAGAASVEVQPGIARAWA